MIWIFIYYLDNKYKDQKVSSEPAIEDEATKSEPVPKKATEPQVNQIASVEKIDDAEQKDSELLNEIKAKPLAQNLSATEVKDLNKEVNKKIEQESPQILNKELIETIDQSYQEKIDNLKPHGISKSISVLNHEQKDAKKIAEASSAKVLNKEIINDMLEDDSDKAADLTTKLATKSAKIQETEEKNLFNKL